MPENNLREDVRAVMDKAAGLVKSELYCEAERTLIDIVRKDSTEKGQAAFLLGKLYTEVGFAVKAEEYLLKAADDYPLLRDYALKLLVDVYIFAGKYERAVEVSKQIKSLLLIQEARKSEIEALRSLGDKDGVVEALSLYITQYPEDWDYHYALAILLKEKGDVARAIYLFKGMYINASPLSEDAIIELIDLKTDIFSKEEILKRAYMLFENYEYEKAEELFKEVLTLVDSPVTEKVKFKIGMSQFRQKKYDESAKSFGMLGTPQSMYWQARSFYRIDRREEFDRVKREFEKKYPTNNRLALLYLMEADEFRRRGILDDARTSYTKVLEDFPKNKEDALWGLAWMNYTSGDYQSALDYFIKLAEYEGSKDFYKYLYWMAKSRDRLVEECVKSEAARGTERNEDFCGGEKERFFEDLPADESYYGYLIRLRSRDNDVPEKVSLTKPATPEGESYERIEALALLGMRDEAVKEINALLKKTSNMDVLLYLGYMAIDLNEFNSVIAFAEGKKARVFLPYAYPLGYPDILKEAAESESLDAHLVAAVIREESRFDPEAVSWAGAIGLMQLMPLTADRLKADINISLSDSSELQDVRKNILLGTHYLSMLVNEFGEIPLAIAAYNAGENALKKWLERFDKNDITEFIENIPYKETRRYVKKVLKSYWNYRRINGFPVAGFEQQS